MRARAGACGLVAQAMAAGCTATAPVPEVDCAVTAPSDAAVTLELRSGPGNTTLLRTLGDGDAVGLTPGPQGGQHVWVQVRSRELCPNRPRVTVRVLRATDGAVIGGVTGLARWTEEPGAGGLYASTVLTAFVDNDAYCPLLTGGAIRVQVRVEDALGRVGEREWSLRVEGWTTDSNASLREARENCCADLLNTRCWPAGPPDGG